MARGVNTVTLLGNVGKAPEIKYTTGGTAVASFSLATTKKYKDKSGEYQDKTQWHNLKAFGKVAEIVEKFVEKGKQVYVSGEIDYSSWDDKETGQRKYKTEIVVNELVLLGGGSKDEMDQSPRKKAEDIPDDESIPF